ncbi:hypothetical protein [Cupriavidus sp. PET2-C1]
MKMTVPDSRAAGGGARWRGLAACLAAMLCTGCAPGPQWWRPPRPKANAVAPAASMPACNALCLSDPLDRFDSFDPLLATGVVAIEAPRQPAHSQA